MIVRSLLMNRSLALYVLARHVYVLAVPYVWNRNITPRSALAHPRQTWSSRRYVEI